MKTMVNKEIVHPLYIEREEMWVPDDGHPGQTVEMHSAYAHDGSYIGQLDEVRSLFDKFGIKPERRTSTNKVASVGYSEKEKAWFGWSHRALSRFPTRDEAAEFAESVS